MHRRRGFKGAIKKQGRLRKISLLTTVSRACRQAYFSGLSGNGPLVTKTLLFMNQANRRSEESGGRETGVMRAYDKATGKIIWEHAIDSAPIGAPVTYMQGGKQYIAYTVGGSGNEMELVAYSLP